MHTPPPQSDLLWNDLPTYAYDGVPLGNSVMGALLHRQDAGRGDGDPHTLRFELNRADLVDSRPRGAEGYRWARRPVGAWQLKPQGAIIGSELRLDLATARLRGRITTDLGHWELEAWVAAGDPVLIIQVQPRGKEAVRESAFAPDAWGRLQDYGRVDFQETATFTEPDPPADCGLTGAVGWHRQTMIDSGRSWELAWRRWDGAAGMTTWAVALTQSHPQTSEPRPAAEVLARLDLDTLQAAHDRWWQSWYEAGAALEISDGPWESFWWIQQYKLGCTLRPDGPMMDLMGPWYVHTIWPAIWWNWNTQAMYAGLPACGRSSSLEPLRRTLEAARTQLNRNVPARVRTPETLAIGRASWIEGDAPLDLDDAPPHANREVGNLTWVLHDLYLGWQATRDPHWARATHGLLTGAVALYLQLLEEGADGRLHLPTTFSPEYAAAPDCSYDLMLLRWACGALLELDEALGLDDPRRARWAEVRLRLVEPMQDAEGVHPGRGLPLRAAHRHFSHLMGWWLGDRSYDDPVDRALLRRTIEHWKIQPTDTPAGALAAWSWAAIAFFEARLGNGAAALDALNTFRQGLSHPTLYREAGMCSETPYCGMHALQEMFLGFHGNCLRPFQAIPPTWTRGSFRDLWAGGCRCSGRWDLQGFYELEIVGQGPVTLRLPPGWSLPGNGQPNAAGIAKLDLATPEGRRLLKGVCAPQQPLVRPPTGHRSHN